MILRIILFIFILLVIVATLFFLACVLSPAVSEQTKISENIIFSKIEHNFSKLNKENQVEKIETDKKAVVLCACDKKFSSNPPVKNIPGQSCAVIASEYASISDCPFMCVGKGDCVPVCPQGAIIMQNETAVISNFCIGCGKCVSACPKGIIKLVDKTIRKTVICANNSERLTTCDSLKKEQILTQPEKKYFKIFQKCYKIVFG